MVVAVLDITSKDGATWIGIGMVVVASAIWVIEKVIVVEKAKDGVVELAEQDPDSSRKLIEYAKDLTLPKLLTVLGFLLIAWGVGLVSGNVAIL